MEKQASGLHRRRGRKRCVATTRTYQRSGTGSSMPPTNGQKFSAAAPCGVNSGLVEHGCQRLSYFFRERKRRRLSCPLTARGRLSLFSTNASRRELQHPPPLKIESEPKLRPEQTAQVVQAAPKFEVQAIVGHEVRDTGVFFKVRWADDSETWEPLAHVSHVLPKLYKIQWKRIRRQLPRELLVAIELLVDTTGPHAATDTMD